MQLTQTKSRQEQALEVIHSYLKHILVSEDKLIEVMKVLWWKNETELLNIIKTLEDYLQTKRNLEKSLLTKVQTLTREFEERKQNIVEDMTLDNYFNF